MILILEPKVFRQLGTLGSMRSNPDIQWYVCTNGEQATELGIV